MIYNKLKLTIKFKFIDHQTILEYIIQQYEHNFTNLDGRQIIHNMLTFQSSIIGRDKFLVRKAANQKQKVAAGMEVYQTKSVFFAMFSNICLQ